MVLALNEPPTVTEETCPTCARRYRRTTGFVLRDGDATAIYFASCHSHEGVAEVWVDVVTGSWVEPDFADHATFSCRVTLDGAGLVEGLVASEGTAPFFGHRLNREDALVHPRLTQLWELVDFLVITDPTVTEALSGTT